MPCGAVKSGLLGLKHKFWTHGNNPRIDLGLKVAFQQA